MIESQNERDLLNRMLMKTVKEGLGRAKKGIRTDFGGQSHLRIAKQRLDDEAQARGHVLNPEEAYLLGARQTQEGIMKRIGPVLDDVLNALNLLVSKNVRDAVDGEPEEIREAEGNEEPEEGGEAEEVGTPA